MRNQTHNTDLIRYRYNVVAEDGRTVIRAVPVRAHHVVVESEPVAAGRNDVERERTGQAIASPVLERIRHRLLER